MRRALLVCSSLALALAAAARAEERLGPGALRYDLTPAKGATAEQPRDLVLGLHGKDGKKETMGGWLEKLLPPLADTHRVWVQSNTPHWERDVIPPLAELVRRLRRELPVRHVIVIGFSAGGFLATGLLFEQPETFDAALVAGATWWGRPGSDAAKARPIFWSVGEDDSVVKKNGGPEHLRAALGEVGYPEERWQIDVVPGLGHTLDGASLGRGLTFLREKLGADEALRPEERTKLEELQAAIKAKDGAPEAIRAAAAPLLAARRREGLRALAQALLPLLKEPAGERGQVALELAAEVKEPLLGAPLAKAWGKVKKDEAAALALLGALGALEAGAGLPALVDRLGEWELEGKAQLAAAEALGAGGNPAALDPLIAALRGAEKKKGREAYAAALEAALRAISGAEEQGSAAWQAWRQKGGK